MHIYVLSAGFVEDYSRRSPENAPPQPEALRSWHRELANSDAYFALVAGRTEGAWYIEFRNLLLPEKYDIRNRSILLNICFGALESEAQVRALALAYLDFELVFCDDKCAGRLCPALAEAYRTQDGDYTFDFAAAQKWAEKVLTEFEKQPPATQEICPVYCHTNPEQDTYTANIRNLLLTRRLSNRDGLRLLWAEIYTNSECGADIILQYTSDTGFYKQATAAPPATQSRSKVMLWLILAGILTMVLSVFLYLCFNGETEQETAKKISVGIKKTLPIKKKPAQKGTPTNQPPASENTPDTQETDSEIPNTQGDNE